MAYGDYKDLPRTGSNNVLWDKAFNIAKNPKSNGYQCASIYRFALIVYKFFDKKSLGGAINSKTISNYSLQTLLYSSFKGNIWGADVVDMQLIGKCH